MHYFDIYIQYSHIYAWSHIKYLTILYTFMNHLTI